MATISPRQLNAMYIHAENAMSKKITRRMTLRLAFAMAREFINTIDVIDSVIDGLAAQKLFVRRFGHVENAAHTSREIRRFSNLSYKLKTKSVELLRVMLQLE